MKIITFNELLTMISKNAKELKSCPKPEQLRKMAGDPIIQARNGEIQAYSNGYAYYSIDGSKRNTGYTVLWIPDCATYDYLFLNDSGKSALQKVLISEDVLGEQPWYIAIALKGESRIETNLLNRTADRVGKKVESHNDIVGSTISSSASRAEEPLSLFVRNDTIRESLEKLTETQRTIFLSYHWFRYSQKQIAEVFGISQQTVSRHLKAAERKLKKS